MKSCEFYQELISRRIDGELSEEETAVLARHLETCPECSALYAAFCGISSAIGEELAEPPESLSQNVMAELRRAGIAAKNKRKRSWKGPLATAACLAVVIAAAWYVPNRSRCDSAAPMSAPAAQEYSVTEDTAPSAGYGEIAPEAAEEPAEGFTAEDTEEIGPAPHDEDAGEENGALPPPKAAGSSAQRGQNLELTGDQARQFAALLHGEETEFSNTEGLEPLYVVRYELDGTSYCVYVHILDGQVLFSFDDARYCLSLCTTEELETLLFPNLP